VSDSNIVDTASSAATAAGAPAPRKGGREPRVRSTMRAGDRVFLGFSTGSAVFIMVILAGVAIFLIIKALPAIFANWTTNSQLHEGPTLAFDSFWSYVGPLLWGTLWVSAIAIVIAAPVSIGIALFISHYSPRRLAGALGSLVDLLAAVPSVVFGLWGIIVIRPFLRPLGDFLNQYFGWIPLFAGQPSTTGSTILAGSVVLAVMILPIITSISREIFLQTPRLMIRLAVLPYARSGMVSAILLGLGRALGETMAIALIISPSIVISVLILTEGNNPQTIAANAALNFPIANALQRDALIGTGLMLFVVSLGVNLLARFIVDATGPGATRRTSRRLKKAAVSA
jgi:phosphate transport system permease protein